MFVTRFQPVEPSAGLAAAPFGNLGQDRLPLAAQLGLGARHRPGQRLPALGPQVVAGGLQPVLEGLQLGGIDGQGVAQDRLGVFHRVALGQLRPGRQGSPQQARPHHQDKRQHQAAEALEKAAEKAAAAAGRSRCAHGLLLTC